MTEPTGGTPVGGGIGGFWRRRSRKGKVWIAVAAVVALIAIIGALASPSDDRTQASGEQVTVTQTVVENEPTTTREAAPPPPLPPPAERPPRPIIIRGQGARVATINVARDSPAVVAAVHRGSSNFVIELVGTAESKLLVNEIGSYNGSVAYADAAAGRHRMKVEADGPWTVWVTQPVPTANAKLATISGRGPRVVRIRTEEDLQPIVDVAHRGRSNFIVELIGYGDTTGSELLVNEIGTYSGQTLVNDLPEGGYLLAVEADGSWTARFTR